MSYVPMVITYTISFSVKLTQGSTYMDARSFIVRRLNGNGMLTPHLFPFWMQQQVLDIRHHRRAE